MQVASILLMAVALAMDAFAVSVCKGLSATRIDWRRAFATALSFGLFQALMPALGWALGESVSELIEPIDHWIAFALLAAIGAKMVVDAVREDPCDDMEGSETSSPEGSDPSSSEGVPSRSGSTGSGFLLELIALSVATSIDALAAGISFSMAGLPVLQSVVAIGVVTFALSLAGFALGNRFGASFNKPANIAGGAVLVVLGLKILLEDLGLI